MLWLWILLISLLCLSAGIAIGVRIGRNSIEHERMTQVIYAARLVDLLRKDIPVKDEHTQTRELRSLARRHFEEDQS